MNLPSSSTTDSHSPSDDEVDQPLDIPRVARRSILKIILFSGMGFAIFMGLVRVYGLPRPVHFTACPTAFFKCALFLCSTGGALGFTSLARSQKEFQQRVWLCLFSGSCLIGFQTYGLWSLFGNRSVVGKADVWPPFILVFAHLMSCWVLLTLFSLTSALRNERFSSPEYKMYLKACSIAWFCLGLSWPFLMASFAIML
ncbi:hypothetical protein SH668x_000719 [Planctomicrobium sp. SH668]|uniref:hypothetical protein n=1 Tax=Planctomicrobium sp. SH668 TaxID=3448126 RepID=UPI003F5AFE3B